MKEEKQFIITYRGEFEIEVTAKDRDKAIQKAQSGDGEISCVGDLWEDFMEISEEGIDFEVEKND